MTEEEEVGTVPDEGAVAPPGNTYETPAELKDNPAWAPFLDVLPTDLHGTVKPVLKEWDKNVNNQFQKIHSQYADWKTFQDEGVSADELRQGYALLQQINEDPKRVWDAIAEHYGFEVANAVVAAAEQGSTELGATEEDFGSGFEDPRFEQLNKTVETMAELLIQENQNRENAQADAEFQTYFDELKAKHGQFDEEYVLNLITTGMDGDDAVARYQSVIDAALTARNIPKAPVVVGNGSSALPSGGLDVTKLDSKNTKSLVADMLRQAAEERDR